MNNLDEVRILEHNQQNCALVQFWLLTSTTTFGGQMQDGCPVITLW
ncbi:MAG: hypothetical protein JGK12_03835 [Microcoleus sp. PH2017_01_SCD_O_A]|nr:MULTISPECIES: hypothetical protein [unclassified Microcoleus]MCC3417188.1 hypothetical protein [Microcoleus sp. PH2017_07_MST_O_A]MCC3423066.1 hypothetical protein [Microcoleus sp. PH2017_01_SCD_O_A]MCC3433713.1 hypothetical protein [Microcoleus sp. PH2017_04_SCI_O_A]MCC3452612.1 hypothetical protein [Microcoleus sp. PH2017_08_TRC_O_A]